MPGVPGQGRGSGASREVNPAATLDALGFGIAVGHATDEAGATGLTVVRGVDAPLRASAHVVGRATGTRELALLDPRAGNDRIDAILLTGGSAYGLDAAAGVMRWMEERGRGFPIAGGVVPIVPAAVVFDLAPLGRFDARPTADMAYRACGAAATHGIEEGSVGAGTGCTVGKALGPARAMKGGVGVGTASTGGTDGLTRCCHRGRQRLRPRTWQGRHNHRRAARRRRLARRQRAGDCRRRLVPSLRRRRTHNDRGGCAECRSQRSWRCRSGRAVGERRCLLSADRSSRHQL